MSALESAIWYTLGYLAMPTILIFGFIGSAVVICMLLEGLGWGKTAQPALVEPAQDAGLEAKPAVETN